MEERKSQWMKIRRLDSDASSAVEPPRAGENGRDNASPVYFTIWPL